MQARSRKAGVAICARAAVVLIAATCAAAHADVASDQPAAILIFPKVLVDITSPQVAPPAQIDTLIRVTNTNSANAVFMHCFYIDATPQCQADATKSCLSSPFTCPIPGTNCQAPCQETDFDVYLTAAQPVAWLASPGAGLCSMGDTLPCFPETPPVGVSTLVPGVADPFLGELVCIEVDGNGTPVNQNDLKGEAEIIRSSPDAVDVESYNAIGYQAIAAPSGGGNTTTTLTLGPTCPAGSNSPARPCMGPLDCGANGLCSACPDGVNCSAEYNASPGVLILDHFTEGAVDPVSGFPITTDLTLVPSSRDIAGSSKPPTLFVQFVVFNEFEQRLSTSTTMSCLHEFKLSDIATASPQNVLRTRSIFGAGTLGTLTAQTRLQAVSDATQGNALLGIAEEFRVGGGSAAVNLHFSGSRPQSDFIYLPQTP